MALAHVEMRAQNLRAARAGLGLTHDEDPDFASARIDLYAKQRKKKHRP